MTEDRSHLEQWRKRLQEDPQERIWVAYDNSKGQGVADLDNVRFTSLEREALCEGMHSWFVHSRDQEPHALVFGTHLLA